MPQHRSDGPGPGPDESPGGSDAGPPGENADGHEAPRERPSAPFDVGGARRPVPLDAMPPDPVPAKPANNRGCAVAAVTAAAVVMLLVVGAGAWAIVALAAPDGDYEAAPDCSVAPDEVLDGLVPARETELNQRIEDFDPERRDGYECRWATSQTAAQVPAAARLVLVRHAGADGTPGTEAASAALRAAVEGKDADSVAGIGDEAEAWNETVRGFDWGCVAVRMSNLYAMSCHTAAVDYQAGSSVPDDVALSNAESLARSVTEEIGSGG
ncbi:hypothetical protein [Streptomonospora salina]